MLFHGPVFVLMVEETIVQVVDVVSVLDGCMATALTMLVLVMFDFLFAHGSNDINSHVTGQYYEFRTARLRRPITKANNLLSASGCNQTKRMVGVNPLTQIEI